MQRRNGIRWACALGLLLGAAGCSSDGTRDSGAAEECPALGGDPSFTSFTVTPATLAAGDTVDIAIVGENLGELEESADGMDMDEEGEEERSCPGGHLHVYIDDLETNPLTMQEAKA